ncbi:MAG: DUF177 domain-containing protein [Coriobacteriia bacterium]|nr:DUF177 domain-containing protein [Coriobacteriia bacterium]
MDDASYSIDVRTILEDLGASIALDADVEIPQIVLGTESFMPTRPMRLIADITNTGAGIVASGTLDAEFHATCSRCLKEFPLQVNAPLEAFYVAHGQEHELPEEQEFGYINEGAVDLMEQMLASLVLELPYAPLHAEDCPGICPQCGADLAEGPCDCQPGGSDSPFAVLKDLLPPDPEA